ncbi:14882_t:CDS:2, partial [Funneliformis geosporum]
MKTITQLKNTRKFQIIARKTAGLVLAGSEIKAIRNHQVAINEAYVLPHKNELYIYKLSISAYRYANLFSQSPPQKPPKVEIALAQSLKKFQVKALVKAKEVKKKLQRKEYNLRSLKCDACGLANTRERSFSTIPDFSDAITGENKTEKEIERIKENIAYQKEIIQKFLSKNISSELRQELNLIFQERCELEKNIPNLEKLARGQQSNIYEYFLCDKCHQEVTEKEVKIEHDYQDKGLNKLEMNEGIFDQIAQEIGGKETDIILWTSGKNALYSEEEFVKHHKGLKENLIRKLKEERDKLNASQIERLEL